MQAVTTIGLDIAKSVFQFHGVDAAGQVLIRRQLKRRHVLAFFQSCVVPGLALRPVVAESIAGRLADKAAVHRDSDSEELYGERRGSAFHRTSA